MKITKNRYLQGFALTVIFLAIIRSIFPSIAKPTQTTSAVNDSTTTEVMVEKVSEKSDNSENSEKSESSKLSENSEKSEKSENFDNSDNSAPSEISKPSEKPVAKSITLAQKPSRFFNADGTPVKNRIYSVPSFRETFPDSQSVQEVSAHKWGVRPVQNRPEAENRKAELVYVGSNPYFYVEKLKRSIPYLVPRASVLLQDIGRNFFDSLQVKGIPLHKVIVTSVMRTKDDVAKLRNYNGNATENSCHMYGTTFDICYNRYVTVEEPDGPKRRKVQNDSLKWVLSEVLRDLRKDKRCWVKHEVKQGCFHITVR